MTREHVWPDWLCNQLAAIDRLPFTVASHGTLGASHPPYQTRKIKERVRHFCKDCNEGWMGDLEEETKPILSPLVAYTGPPVPIAPDSQDVLARWAFKTALVGDFSFGRNKNDPVPPAVYHVFYHTQIVPSDVFIWMGASIGALCAAHGIRSTYEYFSKASWDPASPPPPSATAYVITLAAFRVVFQVFGLLSGQLRPREAGPEFPYLAGISPATGDPVIWPPGGIALSDDEVTALASRRIPVVEFP